MAEISLSEFNNRQKPTPPKRHIPALNSHIGLLVAAAVVVAGVSFAAGMQYQKGKTPAVTATSTASSRNGSSSGSAGNFRRGGARAFGTVSSVSSSSITIQTRSGGTSTYNITSSTTVTDNGQTSSVSAIQNGDTVIMTLDSSNTQDVSSIMVNPSFGGGGFGGGFSGGSGSGSSAPTPDNSGSDTSGSTTGV